jgi:hypothetical protein
MKPQRGALSAALSSSRWDSMDTFASHPRAPLRFALG